MHLKLTYTTVTSLSSIGSLIGITSGRVQEHLYR